jgi:transporter family-2 protein
MAEGTSSGYERMKGGVRSDGYEVTLTKLPFILTAIAIGGVLALQPGLNAEVARRLGSPFGAGVVSICVSFTLVVALFLSTGTSVSWGAALSMPWYLWLAGTIGVIFVVGTLWLAPILGAALLFVCMIAGQMITATLADAIGFGGYQAQAFDPWRIAGIGLVLAGVWLFQRQ